ncbi:MAG: asparagine--tRNA ligase [Bacteroidota bacterium]
MIKTIQEIIHTTPLDTQVVLSGWIRNKREGKEVIFLDLQDGSQQTPLQLVGDPRLIPAAIQRNLTTGASVRVHGLLRASQGRGQQHEVTIEKIELLGKADETYPLQPKRHTLDFLRSIKHLRFRTNTFRAIFRIRHQLSQAIHRFFDQRGFLYLHTPIITSADAEGAGDLFAVVADLGKGKEKRPFFGKPAYLTVSGQLAGEAGALGLGRIYTFAPTFRAENSNTTRHLAEFWMIEPEMAFCDLKGNIEVAEAFVQYLIKDILENCPQEIAFLSQQEKHKPNRPKIPLNERLAQISTQPFLRITYTEAIDLLKAHKGKKFQFPISTWGADLQTEHEQYLVHTLKRPVVVTDYPKGVKAFYMRQNDDNKTVAAMDVLLPGIGEIIGGSQREERYEKLIETMQAHGINPTDMAWYTDTRRYGSVPHSGFGLGLERMIQFITVMDNIRDVIPFPRTPGKAEA